MAGLSGAILGGYLEHHRHLRGPEGCIGNRLLAPTRSRTANHVTAFCHSRPSQAFELIAVGRLTRLQRMSQIRPLLTQNRPTKGRHAWRIIRVNTLQRCVSGQRGGSSPDMLRTVVLLMLLAGCSAPIEELQLSNGHSLGEYAARADSALVLLVDPAMCFGCDDSVSAWLRRARRDSVIRLVFTRPPSEDEAFQLRLQRIEPDAVVVGGLHISRRRTAAPTIALFAGQRAIATVPPFALSTNVLVRDFVSSRMARW
jgi:hypothetical protein